MQNREVYLTKEAFAHIRDTVGSYSPETGAIIGAHNFDPLTISAVWYDQPAEKERNYYRPSALEIERVVKEWAKQGIRFCGVIHSHRACFPEFSSLDQKSAMAIMEANALNSLVMGLYCSGSLKISIVSGCETGYLWETALIHITNSLLDLDLSETLW